MMRKTEVQLFDIDGEPMAKVEGWTDGSGLALHRVPSPEGGFFRGKWNVTHMASGMRIRGPYTSKAKATAVVTALAALDVDWKQEAEKLQDGKVWKLVREALEGIANG